MVYLALIRVCRKTGISPSQYKIKQSNHNYETNQVKYKLDLKTTQFIIAFGKTPFQGV